MEFWTGSGSLVDAGYPNLVGKFIIETELKVATAFDGQAAFLHNF